MKQEAAYDRKNFDAAMAEEEQESKPAPQPDGGKEGQVKNCDSCSGSGVQPEDPEYLPAYRRCDDCGGTGEVKPRRRPTKKKER
jgi:DnaJ-class molecular chaperone